MLEVAKNLEEEGAGSRADERRVGRLVGEAMGRVGRGTWDQGRKGIGKMAAFRVPVGHFRLLLERKETDNAVERC